MKNHHFPIRTISIVAFAVLLFVAFQGVANSAFAAEQKYSWQAEKGESLALLADDSIVWRLNYGPNCPKPYFDPVSLPGGLSLTWTAPPDHPWHLAFWFSWKYINRVNYWEYDKSGKSAGLTELADIELTPRDDGSARILMAINYRVSKETPVVLAEKRTIEISTPDESGRYEFDWMSQFAAGETDVELERTPPPEHEGGKAWGGYAGLSIRFAKGLTERQFASTITLEDRGTMARYQGDLKAMDYNGMLDGKPVGIAVVEHPKSFQSPTPWYVIRSNVMSYINPAVISYDPITLQAGKSFMLKYRVIVHPGRWGSEQLKREVASE